uniref:CCHC-type domain-containing protein n=1 Tax=Takifugu rubripes TaxID=31033 RepID=A0A674NT60_TAKRU
MSPVVVSNVPPFFKNDMLLRKLSRHGRIVSPMRLIPLGTKSLLLRHVVSFRRQVAMVLNNNEEELKPGLRFRVDDFDYTVFTRPTDSQKCFGCGEEGHLIRSCPKGAEARRPANLHVSAAPCARSDAGTTAEVEEPAGPQGDHPGDHLDLQNERFTGEMVEQTAIRMIETVLDNEDVGVEESSLSVATKRKSTDTKGQQRQSK